MLFQKGNKFGFTSENPLDKLMTIGELAGLTKALHEKSWEFVIHVKNDYDYRMESKE